MDWQQPAALAIVAVAAVLLLAPRFRRRKFDFKRDTACGCSGNAVEGATKSSIIFHARKGEKPEVVVKMR
jgi:hypothetical protein